MLIKSFGIINNSQAYTILHEQSLQGKFINKKNFSVNSNDVWWIRLKNIVENNLGL